MNMISTGAFQNEMDASNKTETLVTKLVSAWEKKNAKVARAGGVSLMALSLAACGSSDDDSATTDTTTTVSTPATPVVDAAKTLTLSTNTDVLTGGSGDDTIAGSSASLSADDIVDGAGGTDIMKLSHSGGAATEVPNISNVETIAVTNVGTAALEMNLAASSGYSTLQSLNSSTTGDVTWTGVKSMATLAHDGVGSTAITKAVFDNALTKGTADSVSITLAGGSSINLTIGGVTAANEFETYNVSSTGTSANGIIDILASDGSALVGTGASIVITGDADTTLGTAAAPIDMGTSATVDASAATGKITVNLDDLMQTVTLGSGDDTVDATTSQLEGDDTNKHSLDGGAGTDTLIIDAQFDTDSLDNNTAGTTATATKNDDTVVNFEVIHAKGTVNDANNTAGNNEDGVAFTVDLSAASFDDVTLTLDNPDDDADDLTLTVSNITTQTISASGKDGNDTSDETSFTMSMKDASGAADTLTVKSVASGAATAHVNVFTNVTITDTATKAVETLNLHADRADITSGGTTTVGTTINAIAAGDTTTLDIDGSGGLTINGLELNDPAGTASNAVIDATGHSGNLTLAEGFKTTASDLMNISLGAGKNSVSFGAEALSGDKVTGSTGTDTVNLTEAATDVEMTITGVDTLGLKGEGADQVISMKNVTVTTVDIYDRANNDTTTDNIKITNLNQAVNIHSTNATKGDWDGGTITLDMLTGVTALDATIKGGIALEGTGILSTDATNITLTDANTNASTGFYYDQAIVLSGTTAAAPITALTLNGGGASAATTTATLSVDGTNNVSIATVNASGLDSDLDLVGLTTAAGATVTLHSTGGTKVTVDKADAGRDSIDVVGGTGADTLAVAAIGATGGTTSVYFGSTGVETLNVGVTDDGGGTSGAAFTVDAADMTGVSTVNFTVTNSAAGVGEHDEGFTVQNLESGTTISFGGDAHGIDLANDANVGVTLNTRSTGGVLTVVNKTGALTVSDNDTDAANNEGIIFGANVATATIKQGVAAAIDIDELDGASITALTIGGSDNGTDGAAFAGAVQANDVDLAKLVTLTVDSNHGAITFGNLGLSAAKLATVNASGDNAITIGGNTTATTAALADVNASGATGAITFGDATDFASTADVALGTGDDTMTINAATNSAITIDMGEKTSDNDTLKLDGDNNLGVTVITLGSTTDQITQMNGGVDSAVQLGIESIDASLLDGSFGVNVTGSAEANTIVGSKNADVLNGGEGADTITGGLGADSITLTESTSKIDTIVLNDKASMDTVTGFVAAGTADKVNITVANIDAEDGNGSAVTGAVTVQSQAKAATTAIALATELLIISDAVTDEADMENELDDLSLTASHSFADDDDLLVLWYDGTHSYLSSVNLKITTNAIDDTGNTVSTLVKFSDVAVTDFAAADFTIV